MGIVLKEKEKQILYIIVLLFSNYILYKALDCLNNLLFRYSENGFMYSFYDALFLNNRYGDSTFWGISVITFFIATISIIIFTKILFSKNLEKYSNIFFSNIKYCAAILPVLIIFKILFGLDNLFILFYYVTCFFVYIRKHVNRFCNAATKKDGIILLAYMLGICYFDKIMSLLFESSSSILFWVMELPLISKLEVCLFWAVIYLYFIILLSFPMLITKIALDKNWSKYLNCFFDHFIYTTIVFIILISYKIYLGADILCFAAFSCIYILAFIRRFIKPIYNYFWILIILCCIGFCYFLILIILCRIGFCLA